MVTTGYTAFYAAKDMNTHPIELKATITHPNAQGGRTTKTAVELIDPLDTQAVYVAIARLAGWVSRGSSRTAEVYAPWRFTTEAPATLLKAGGWFERHEAKVIAYKAKAAAEADKFLVCI